MSEWEVKIGAQRNICHENTDEVDGYVGEISSKHGKKAPVTRLLKRFRNLSRLESLCV